MTDPTTPEGRAELRQMLDKATVRPWTIHSDRYGRDEITARHQAGWNEVVAQVGRARPDAGLIVAAVTALPALLAALDDAECEIERQRGDLVIERRRANAAEAALAEAQETIRGYEGAVEGLAATIGEQRAQLESIREYAEHLHELADAHRETSTGYLAHIYAEIAATLERKIGDRT